LIAEIIRHAIKIHSIPHGKPIVVNEADEFAKLISAFSREGWIALRFKSYIFILWKSYLFLYNIRSKSNRDD